MVCRQGFPAGLARLKQLVALLVAQKANPPAWLPGLGYFAHRVIFAPLSLTDSHGEGV